MQLGPAFGHQDGNTVQDALRQRHRSVAPQNHRCEGVFSVQGRNGRNKLGHTSWEGMMCGLSQSGRNSFGIWNPKTCRVVVGRNFVFVETPPHLLPPSRRLSPLQGLERPSFVFSDKSLDDNYTSRNHMVQSVRDYTSSLDFGVNDPAKLLNCASLARGFSPGGVTPHKLPSSSASLPAPAAETEPAPALAPASLQATTTGTNSYAMEPRLYARCYT